MTIPPKFITVKSGSLVPIRLQQCTYRCGLKVVVVALAAYQYNNWDTLKGAALRTKQQIVLSFYSLFLLPCTQATTNDDQDRVSLYSWEGRQFI